MKNKQLVVLNLQEVVETLKEIIDEVSEDECSEPKLKQAMEQAYQHMNYAWHIHNKSAADVEGCSQADILEWSKMPVGEINEYR